MGDTVDDDFWLAGVPGVRWADFAPVGAGPTLLEVARHADSPDVPLPDQASDGDRPGELAWAPGALAGVLAHHTAGASEPEPPFLALATLVDLQASGRLTRADLLAGYESMRSVRLATPRDVGMAISAVGAPPTAQAMAAYSEAAGVLCGWLVCRGQHRGPVKAGLALAMLFSWEPLAGRAAELGRLAELSAEACRLLRTQEPPDEAALLALAKWHDGWGRVNAVEGLIMIDPRSPETDDWLVVEGWRNRVSPGYSAPLVAQHVDVASRVLVLGSDGSPDRVRLAAARDMLHSLLDPHSPGAWMADLPDMVEIIDQWLLGLSLLAPEQVTAADLALADALGEELGTQGSELVDAFSESDSVRIGARCAELLSAPSCRGVVQRAVAGDDPAQFSMALRVAGRYGVDPLPALMARLTADPDDMVSWHAVAIARTPGRAAELVEFALRVLPPDLMSTTTLPPGARRPADVHRGVHLLWTRIGREDPGTRWRLIEALLRSGAVPARQQGAAWLAALPAPVVVEHEVPLRAMLAAEPDPGVREALGRVLDAALPADPPPRPQPEQRLREAEVLSWRGPSMGMTTFTARAGILTLTTHRLVFRTRAEDSSHDIPLAAITSCTAGRKRALVVTFRDPTGQEQALTFGQRMGMPDLAGWVAAVEAARDAVGPARP